jgi:hypothetical protein
MSSTLMEETLRESNPRLDVYTSVVQVLVDFGFG